MNGKYRGKSRPLTIAAVLLLWGYAYVWLIFIEDRVGSAAGAVLSIIPTLLGAVALAFSQRLPCRFTADEKCVIINTGGIKHRYPLGEIAEISCLCERCGDDKTSVKLTITDSCGRTARFTEIHGAGCAELKCDPNAKKPQLMRLYEYLQSLN